MTLLIAPNGKLLKITEIIGNKELIKQLSILNIHLEDIIEKNKGGFLGPLVIRKIQDNNKVAIGKNIAKKIIVEIPDEII
jgi:Fe2+ transport system protein FeoA